MNKMEPADFPKGAGHKSQGDNGSSPKLNEMARQIAAHYRNDTISPTMVSGVLRLVEFTLLMLSGAALFVIYVGLNTDLDWHYPIAIVSGSLVTAGLLGVNNCYQLPSLMRPISTIPRIMAVW